MREDGLRKLPSIDRLLRTEAFRGMLAEYPRWAVVRAARAEVDRHRTRLLKLAEAGPDGDSPDPERIRRDVERLVRAPLRPAINVTGVVLHTNLGRAPLSERALDAVLATARGYCTLEYDPESRARGSRQAHVSSIAAELVGAESALVVNNNAGAVLVALAALAANKRVIVSRGELVEIGGGFRVPDVMRWAGAELAEVGTTNKTHARDYASELAQGAALVMKVHRSNFRITGFTAEVGVAELATLAHGSGVPLFYDLGAGLLEETEWALPPEPSVRSVLAAGVDLCAFSGDKLLGGPQAGILVGKRALIEPIARHPLTRALRPDKMCIAALYATLQSYRDGTARAEIPALKMLCASASMLETRRDNLLSALREAGISASAGRLSSAVGGGALPGAELESPVVWLDGVYSPDDLAAALARGVPAVVVRLHEQKVVMDVRTLADGELPTLVRAIASCMRL